MRVPLFWQVLPVHLLILSFFLLPIWQHHAAVANAMAAGQAAQQNLKVKQIKSQISGHPVRVIIPRLGIDLPIVDGQYNFNSSVWSVSATTANYAVNTAKANNNRDKTLVYGHWTNHVFGPTKNLKQGDTAYIYTDNGHIFKYVYEYKHVVKPRDTSVFQTFKGRPGLVLMTCQGTFAQERRLMFFNLEAAS